ncbi:MAG: tetratricopeptide repeat protein [Candidatus Omnitrophota bacterium]|jgi:tetratricopeptide (TPR) repeat protein
MAKIILVIFLIFSALATTVVYHRTQQADINFYRAQRLFKEGEFEKAIPFYQKSLQSDPFRREAIENLAYSYQWTKKHKEATKLFKDITAKNPGDYKIKLALADTLSWQGNYAEAISLYEEILKSGYNREVKEKLALVLSWDKQYARALKIYDELLKEKEDWRLRRQKARVLGWMKRYSEALKEYRMALSISSEPLLQLEMQAKQAYWDNRVKAAIRDYRLLIKEDPRDLEARSDLSQVYASQSMWQEAIRQYNRILEIAPDYFQAKAGREKAELLEGHPYLKSGYEFFEADSAARDSDIKRHSFFNHYGHQLNNQLNLEADYRFTSRSFADFGDVGENEGRLKLSYLSAPDWRVSGFYDFILYNKGIRTMHAFGAELAARARDAGIVSFSYARERLENNSTVIRKHLYSDNYKERFDWDINKRFKLGADYLYAYFSDSNYKHEPGLDALYYFSFEPRRLFLKYRYFYRNFRKKVSDYFSPKGFSTNSLALSWRHSLRREELFFGQDELYYDLGYEVTVDSKNIVGHKFSAELNWDINKRINFNIKSSLANSSASVYRDRSVVASLKYYF